MKLFTEMENETGRFAGETADGGKGKVGSNQEVGGVGGVDFAGDGSMVWLRAGRLSLRTVFPSGASQTRRKTTVSRDGVVVPR